MSQQPNILVVGSVNVDMVVRCPEIPVPGQTVFGSEGLRTNPGGKGANQAVAAARMGGHTTMIGCVGDDSMGRELVAGLAIEGINVTAMAVTDRAATGAAMIMVDAKGENAIVVAGGANRSLTADDHLYPNEDLFEAADIVVLQLEIPQPTVWAAITLAGRHGCKVILDPAPCAKNICDDLCKVDVMCPNAVEAETLTGRKTGDQRADRNIALDLITRGAQAVVLTLGSRGALVVSADGELARVEPFKVDIVDTTGAGDAFCGALAVALGQGHHLPAATRIANAAGALACTKLGAQSAMPTAGEVKILLADQA